MARVMVLKIFELKLKKSIFDYKIIFKNLCFLFKENMFGSLFTKRNEK